MENREFELEGLRLSPYPSEYGMAKFDLSLDVTEDNGGLECGFEYATALYKEETVERLANHYEQLLAGDCKPSGCEDCRAEHADGGGKRARFSARFNPEHRKRLLGNVPPTV